MIKLSNIETLMDKIGIKSTVIKTGKFKDAGSPVRELTAEDRAMFQSVIDSTHNQFIKAVASGRKLPEDEVRRIADGRVLSGEQALELKLVDRLGTLAGCHRRGRKAGRDKGGAGGDPAAQEEGQLPGSALGRCGGDV